MTEVRRILVCGYYGFANTGDEAILDVLLTDLQVSYPDAEVRVLSGRPSATTADHGVAALHWQNVVGMVEAARAADLMVLGGGGLFQDHHGFRQELVLTTQHGGIGYYSGFALVAQLTGTPLVIYGVGVGPLNTDVGRRWTRIAFQAATATSVRDEASRRLLADIGVEATDIAVTADPAWAVQGAGREVADSILALEGVPSAARTITVAVRPWGDYEWAGMLAETLDQLVIDLDARVVFVPFQNSPHPHENDSHASLEVFRRMSRPDRGAIIRGLYPVRDRASLIAASDLLVGMRLHSVIFGLGAGVPTVAIAYDTKVTQSMEEAGLPEMSAPLDTLTREWLESTARSAMEIGPAGSTDRLKKRALENRMTLATPGAPGEPGAEAQRSITELLLDHASVYGDATSDFVHLRAENARLRAQHDYDQISYEKLERQRQELVGTRAVRAVNSYWQLRERLRRLARSVGNRAPAAIRPALRKMASGYREIGPPERPGQVDPEAVRLAKDQVRAVLDQHPDVPGVVVYPPSIGWNVSLFQRPQQMALAFARLGYLVFYGVDAREGIGDRIEPRADSLYLYPVSWAMLEAIGEIPQPITPCYVYNFAWTRTLSDPRVIFEHIDELEVFTTTHRIEDLGEWYEKAVEGAEVVVASARDLMASVEPRRPDVFLCPNGVDYLHFASGAPSDPPEDIADITGGSRPIIGYYGALAEWVDYGLIRRSATELADFEFVFIGPDYDGSIGKHTEVFGLPNVRWLGVKGYDELPAYLHWFDVATIPFVVNEVTNSVSPIKLFEYMAGGRPIVTPNLRECAHYEVVQVAEGADDYVAKVRHAAEVLRHNPEHEALLKRSARANTWEMRVGSLVDALVRSGLL